MGFQQDPWSMPGAPYRRGGGRGWNSSRNRLLWIVGAGMALLAAYTIVLTDEGLLAQRALVKREAELRSLIAEADGRIRVLEWDNDHMETTLERRARQDYDMVRPNELIYRNGEADSARAGASPGIAPRSEPR
jgi:cell division protein FtsB